MIDHILAAGMAATSAAADSELTPTSFSLLTYAWVFGLSLLGGLVSFIQKVRAGETRAFRFTELLGELFTSAFAGVITFYLCKAAGMGELTTAVFVGICGHMGSRAIFRVERIVERWFDSKYPSPPGTAPAPSVPEMQR